MSDLSLQERLARMRASPAVVTSPPDAGAPAEALPTRVQTGMDGEPKAPSYAQQKGRPVRPLPVAAEGASAPRPTAIPGAPGEPAAPAPQGKSGIFERMRNLGARVRDLPAAAALPSAAARLQWEDPERPAGSVFSTEEWQAVRDQSGYARPVVFELHQLAERGLVVLDADALDPMERMFLDQALLIPDKQTTHPAWHHAEQRLEQHCAEFGRRVYRVVHAQAALQRNIGLQGSVLRRGAQQALAQSERAGAPRPRS